MSATTTNATTTGVGRLPVEFVDLEPFAATWCLPTVNERAAQRLASTMDELQAFYDATVPRAEDAIVYLNRFDIDDLPDNAVQLFYLLCSLSVISFAVDVFKQPKVPDSGAGILPVTIEPGP